MRACTFIWVSNRVVSKEDLARVVGVKEQVVLEQIALKLPHRKVSLHADLQIMQGDAHE